MHSVEIDFDVFKALTAERRSESDTFNNVLRRLLKLPDAATPIPANKAAKRPWVSKGVIFDDGTKFRANYKGQLHTMGVQDGSLITSDGKGRSSSLSHAARLVTNTSVDGWTFWDVKRPGDSEWRKAGELRK